MGLCSKEQLSCQRPKLLKYWKQFTTAKSRYSLSESLSKTKVIEILKAIHNTMRFIGKYLIVVKDQSYWNIESNSQPNCFEWSRFEGCQRPKLLKYWKQFTTAGFERQTLKKLSKTKVIEILKAIHNIQQLARESSNVVKDQSYWNIESNSQPQAQYLAIWLSCQRPKLLKYWKQFTTTPALSPYFFKLSKTKVIEILKAIHNALTELIKETEVVKDQSYWNIESNSQPVLVFSLRLMSCQRPKLLKYWKQFTTVLFKTNKAIWLSKTKVIEILKAIHNSSVGIYPVEQVVKDQSYWNIESNSQHLLCWLKNLFCCQRPKLLKYWKQFTTSMWGGRRTETLSKTKVIEILKAIHNTP